MKWPDLLRDKVSWVLLLRISQSFVSKIFTGISLSVFILSHTQHFSYFRDSDIDFRIIMFGGLFFLLGYLVVALYMPSEFRETSSINEAILRQKNIEYYKSFVSRIDMLESMVRRTKERTPPDISAAPVQFAQISIKRAREATENNWKDASSALYLADLNLRQFDFFRWRMLALICLTIGLMATSYSTFIGIFQVLAG